MPKLLSASAITVFIAVFIALTFSPAARAQSASAGQASSKNGQQAPQPALLDGWGAPVKPQPKNGPAPRHDISGTWEPARSPGDGIMAFGPRDMPSDGAPGHE